MPDQPPPGEPVLSVRQPWAWAILHAGKDIENRSRRFSFRGRLWIHASKGLGVQEYEDAAWSCQLCIGLSSDATVPEFDDLTRGAIIGSVEVVDCVHYSTSPWFFGPWGLELRNPLPLAEPVACAGRLGIWRVPSVVG